MAKLAYLGPECTFSHDLAREAFPRDTHVPCETMAAVVNAVADGQCSVGLIPFYNTTHLSVKESQKAVIENEGRIFVTDVLPLPVRHFLGGFGTLNSIKELRSKAVVFHQVSRWLRDHKLDRLTCNDGYVSTAAAIKSLVDEGKPKTAAAIGTASALKRYGVPRLASNIQNKPNVTLFFRIESSKVRTADVNKVLVYLNKPRQGDKDLVENIVENCGCNISSNWAVTLNKKPLWEAYFVEIDGRYSSLGLTSAITQLKIDLKSAFVVGGYSDKCITHLLTI